MSFIQALPGQDQSIIDRVNAKILINNKVWGFIQPPKQNYTQKIYMNYFLLTTSFMSAYCVWMHSPRLQHFCQHRVGRFIVPVMAVTYGTAHYHVDKFSRRALHAMDRYDRDWRNMPTFVPKAE